MAEDFFESSLFPSGWGILANVFGVSVTRTPYGQSPYSLTVMVSDPTVTPEEPGEGKMQTSRCQIQVNAQDSGLVSYPADVRDTFIIDSQTWYVAKHRAGEGLVEFDLVRMDQHLAGGNPTLAET